MRYCALLILCTLCIHASLGHASFRKAGNLKESITMRQAKRDKQLSLAQTENDLSTKKNGDVFYINLSLVRMGLSSFPMDAFWRFQATLNVSKQLPYNHHTAARDTNEPFRVVLGPQGRYVVFADDYLDLFSDHLFHGATTLPVRIVRDDSTLYDEQTFWKGLYDEGFVDFTRPRPQTFITAATRIFDDASIKNFNAKDYHTLYAPDIHKLANHTPFIQNIVDDVFVSNLAVHMPKLMVYDEPPFLRLYAYTDYPIALRIDPRVHYVEEAIQSGKDSLTNAKKRSLKTPPPTRSGQRAPLPSSRWSKIKNFFSFTEHNPPHVDSLIQQMAPAIQYRIEMDEIARHNPRERDPKILNRPDLRMLLSEKNPRLTRAQSERLREIVEEAYHQGDFNHIPYINTILKRFKTVQPLSEISVYDYVDTHQQIQVFEDHE